MHACDAQRVSTSTYLANKTTTNKCKFHWVKCIVWSTKSITKLKSNQHLTQKKIHQPTKIDTNAKSMCYYDDQVNVANVSTCETKRWQRTFWLNCMRWTSKLSLAASIWKNAKLRVNRKPKQQIQDVQHTNNKLQTSMYTHMCVDAESSCEFGDLNANVHPQKKATQSFNVCFACKPKQQTFQQPARHNKKKTSKHWPPWHY